MRERGVSGASGNTPIFHFSVAAWGLALSVATTGCVPPLSRPVHRAPLPLARMAWSEQAAEAEAGIWSSRPAHYCVFHPHGKIAAQHTMHPDIQTPRHPDSPESIPHRCSQRQHRPRGAINHFGWRPLGGQRARLDSARSAVTGLLRTVHRCPDSTIPPPVAVPRNRQRSLVVDGHLENKRDQVPAEMFLWCHG